MGRVLNLKGSVFGRLTAVECVGKDKSNRALWRCVCECGNEKIATSGNLRSGNVQSCGCLAKESAAAVGRAGIIDLTGQRFGRLVVLGREKTLKRGISRWLCQCDCGEQTVTTTGALRSGLTRSCGCLHREAARDQGAKSATHGLTETRLYRVWGNMKTRCYNKRNRNYARWGARGITVCDEWRSDFQAFYDWAMANGYEDGLTIDRIDNDKGYTPDNCRWATPEQQANNTRRVRLIEFRGESHSLHEWSRILGIRAETLFYRLKRLPLEVAFTMPIQNTLDNLMYRKPAAGEAEA